MGSVIDFINQAKNQSRLEDSRDAEVVLLAIRDKLRSIEETLQELNSFIRKLVG